MAAPSLQAEGPFSINSPTLSTGDASRGPSTIQDRTGREETLGERVNWVASNNRLQWTGTLKVGQASKVLFRSAVLRKRSPAPEPGVRPGKRDSGFSVSEAVLLCPTPVPGAQCKDTRIFIWCLLPSTMHLWPGAFHAFGAMLERRGWWYYCLSDENESHA